MVDATNASRARVGRKPKDAHYVGVKLQREIYDALQERRRASGQTMTGIVEAALREYLGLTEVRRDRIVVIPHPGAEGALTASDAALLRELLDGYDTKAKE